ncbi:MAG TPA: hypothetical protein VHB02_11680 [Acidimicrobiales bacterium]|nr:hypothetical protein [Acidimicrobiales bacterium]
MPRRIDIELTSRGSDGTFTWRAAGAKQPKGSLAESMVPDGAAVGDVLRAEVESGLDGLEIVALAAKTAKVEEKPANRIEVLGTPKRGPDVSVTLAPGGRRRRDGDDRRPRRREDRDGGEGRPRPPRGEGRGEGRGEHRDEGGPRRDGAGRRPGPDSAGRRPGGDGARGGPAERRGPADRRGPAKPATSTAHRNAMLAALGPEQLPVAEQLLRGGLPAVRQAIAEQAAKSTGGTPVNGEAILAIAEQLLPAVNLASWKDRATSAQAAGKELRLRDLRAVVAASRAVTLDEEGRTLAKALQDALNHRVTALRDDWVARITTALDESRVFDAVRTANRPPEPATRLPAELAVRISEAAGSAMTAELDADSWLQLLDAVVESSVRRTVKPAGIPAEAEAQDAARRAAGSVPELAKLLGLRIPPPPPRRAPSRRVMATGGGGPATSL